jgi:hypothetical protein
MASIRQRLERLEQEHSGDEIEIHQGCVIRGGFIYPPASLQERRRHLMIFFRCFGIDRYSSATPPPPSQDPPPPHNPALEKAREKLRAVIAAMRSEPKAASDNGNAAQ